MKGYEDMSQSLREQHNNYLKNRDGYKQRKRLEEQLNSVRPTYKADNSGTQLSEDIKEYGKNGSLGGRTYKEWVEWIEAQVADKSLREQFQECYMTNRKNYCDSQKTYQDSWQNLYYWDNKSQSMKLNDYVG